ncbi:MAG: Xaa-Pro peptidase family protein [Rhodobacteraceae bacterium]|nr:Xaa-Pro peptidase family protein [Paracoccaceae bacterium]
MANLDRLRAARLMSEAGIDALLLFSPESFSYATGAAAGVATMWRTAGAVAVLVPADPALPETAVVSDLFAAGFRASSHIEDLRESPIWVETARLDAIDETVAADDLIADAWRRAGRTEGFARPTTFDPLVCYRHLRDALGDRGLSHGRIGFEASAISVQHFPDLRATLEGVDLVDAGDTLARLKMVKTDREIANLRLAVEIAEAGIRSVTGAVSTGVTRDALAAAWSAGIAAHPRHDRLSGAWEYISVGPNPWGGNATARAGDLVKVDVGCLVEGYTSDTGRTFVLGPPTAVQKRIFDALSRGFEAGAQLLQPGTPLSLVHARTLAAIRAAGFPGYTRGHFGHGLGAGTGSEEWPFFSADARTVLEPGMVMAFECPWYIDGLGGMIVENQVLITQDGHEMMNTLPRDLIQIGP